MQGVCTSCGGPTSTEHTVHCKGCYKTELKKKYNEEKAARDKEIVLQITRDKMRAAEVARIHNLSREAVRLILKRNGVDYNETVKTFPDVIDRNKKKEDKLCLWCGQPFEVNKDGARVKYCSDDCYQERHKLLQRERVKAYYQTPEGKEAQRKYVEENRDKIRNYFKTWSATRTGQYLLTTAQN